MSKSTGSYYTPQKLVEFIVNRVTQNFTEKTKLRVLEPSCGDGAFLQAFQDNNFKGNVILEAVEKNPQAIKLAKKNTSNLNKKVKLKFIQGDFLKVKLETDYDLVVGNPPYIGRKLLTENQRSICAKIHVQGGLAAKSIRNIWPAFVVKSSQLLNENGVLAFVLPGELLQVNYAKEIRNYLEKNFSSVEILTFENLVFSALGQDVVVVFAYKSSMFSGVRYAKIKDVEKLNNSIEFVKRESLETVKWSNFVLDDNDLDFLSGISGKLKKISNYCTSSPGVVTGANNFFIVNKDTVAKYKLQEYSKPILQKSSFIENGVSFSSSQLEKLQRANEPSFLIDLGNTPYKSLSVDIKAYLQLGRKNKVHTGFKCRNRKPWYSIPVVWVPVGVVFKRSHLYPKLIRNDASALVTDAAYRIIPCAGCNIESIIYSFFNSLTLTFCELNGRYYGGGVLELTPSEFKGLPLPYKNITKKEFSLFGSKFKDSVIMDNLIKENDVALLSVLGLELSDIERIQKIREKLLSHRLRTTP
jgi:adenine-specific DNA-methyltransferase